MKRDKVADLLKGYACFLVLFGHVIMGVRKCGQVDIPVGAQTLENVIWSYHVALFMFVSGYVYRYTGGWERKGSRIKYILYKLLDLGVPYVFFSVIYIAVNSMVPGVNNKSELTDILSLYKYPTAQYWFIYALFFIFVIYILINSVIKSRILVTILLFTVYIALDIASIKAGFLTTTVSTMGYFALGTCFDRLDFTADNNRGYVKALMILAVILHIGIAWIINLYVPDYNVIIKILLAVLGFAGAVSGMNLILKFDILNRIILFITKYSFPIYLLHTIFTSAVRIALVKLGIDVYLIHIVVGTAVGLFIPAAAAAICDKIGWAEFVFYPSRTIRKLKSEKKK